MRVLIDTSAWVDFFNGYDSSEARTTASLLGSGHDVVTCDVVVAELFQGFRDARRRHGIEALFRRMEFLEADGIELALRSAEIFRELRSRGITVRSTIDCLIMVLAERESCAVLAKDRDLRLIAGSGLLRVPALP